MNDTAKRTFLIENPPTKTEAHVINNIATFPNTIDMKTKQNLK